jgi:hypothetical protein
MLAPISPQSPDSSGMSDSKRRQSIVNLQSTTWREPCAGWSVVPARTNRHLLVRGTATG